MKTILHFHLIVITSVLLSVDSCTPKPEKETTATSSTTTTQQQTTTTTTTQSVTPQPINATTTPKDDNVRFIVSFYSIGQGIDGNLHGEFVKFLDSYPKKIAYESKQWGREGEKDYCLALKELSEIEQDEFIRKAKKILSTNVNITQDAVCTHKKTDAAKEKYKLIISFTSIGEGINLKANEEFEKFLSSNSPKVKHELVIWGREGEKDYCFKLTELSVSQQEEFIMKSTEIATKKVHIHENEKCKH